MYNFLEKEMFFAVENLIFLVVLTILNVDGAPKENRGKRFIFSISHRFEVKIEIQ